ncbi:LptF/LptG family permease, partial [Devosia sp.]|uniref:LptF/LptG family permease n=1 Tax=Devosia sp. TaxID=1871048 RepID=UPI0025E711BB
MTADSADIAGQRLTRVFIRRLDSKGQEEIITAASADLKLDAGGKTVTMDLRDGRRIARDPSGEYRNLAFNSLTTQTPLAAAAVLLRDRGGDERELTLGELAKQAKSPNPIVSKSTLLSELYGRLARAAFLPFLPLLAFPLGLASKRGNRAPGLIMAGVLLLAFQHALLLGQGLAKADKAAAAPAIWIPSRCSRASRSGCSWAAAPAPATRRSRDWSAASTTWSRACCAPCPCRSDNPHDAAALRPADRRHPDPRRGPDPDGDPADPRPAGR